MRASACNACRQIKTRCDAHATGQGTCSRCRSLGIACVFDAFFKRSSKARLIQDMASEIRALRHILENTTSRDAAMPTVTAVEPRPSAGTSPPLTDPSPSETSRPTHPPIAHGPSTASTPELPGLLMGSPAQTSSAAADHGCPPFHTRAGLDVVGMEYCIGDVSLSQSQVQEMFQRYFARYHRYLPFSLNSHSPEAILAQSRLLFCVICAVTSERLRPQLQPIIKNLVKETLYAEVHSVETVQALLLLCIWPFKVGFLRNDRSYFYSSMATQISLQLGLHRSCQTHMYRHNWEVSPIADRTVKSSTWLACFVVDRTVSAFLGNPPSIIEDHRLSIAFDDPSIDPNLVRLCRIYCLFSQSSMEISLNGSSPSGLQEPEVRLDLITLFTQRLVDLGVHLQPSDGTIQIVLLFAKVQIQAFVLQSDVPETEGVFHVKDALEDDTCQLVDLCDCMNLSLAPIYIRAAMTYSGYVLSRLLRSSYPVKREVLYEKLDRVREALSLFANGDDMFNKASLVFRFLPFLQDDEHSSLILSRMAAWITYDERRVFWENWGSLPHDEHSNESDFDHSPSATSSGLSRSSAISALLDPIEETSVRQPRDCL